MTEAIFDPALLRQMMDEHTRRYPDMQAGDIVKLVFQACLGPGHLIPSREYALNRLNEELSALSADPSEPLAEPCGPWYVRVNLRRALAEGLKPEHLSSLMMLSSGPAFTRADVDRLCRSLGDPAVDEALETLGDGLPSHTEAYRKAYHPAYRVIPAEAVNALKVLCRLDACKGTGPLCIGIDGRCGSGKTTLAAQLQQILSCPVIHMDDFYTPHSQKTPERLSRPGGNADTERFAAEVGRHLKNGETFSYRPYSCPEDRLTDPVQVSPAPVILVEGSYCLHPETGVPYDVRAFVTVPDELQRQRILRRNGPDMLKRFEEVWIPLEEAYFGAFSLPDRECLVLDGSGAVEEQRRL